MVSVNASQVVPAIPTSDWEYSYVRCNTWQGPFDNELDAATTGLNDIYGACGDQYISDWGRWGTLDEKVQGPCGSTKYHPDSLWDFDDGVEVFNTRKLKATYCNGHRDGFTLKRERTASCPGGYSYNGYTCTLTGTNLLKNAGPMCPLIGNPVYPGTGNKYQREADQETGTSGSVGFIRHYNSRLAYTSKKHTIKTGANWSNTYTRQVARYDHRGIALATVARPEGRAFNYVLDAANSTWIPDEDVKGELEEIKDSQDFTTGWRYKTPGDVTELYDANGRLVSIMDLRGRVQTLTYDDQEPIDPVLPEQSYPTRIDSNTGEYLLFSYSAHRLVSMQDQAGRTWGYRYDGSGNLEFVDNPDQTTRQYHYEDTNNPNALTGITDERGIRYATYEYKSGAQVTASYHGSPTAVLTDRVDGISLVYNTGSSRTLTNSNGQVSVYSTELRNGVRLVTDVSGPGCATCGAANSRYDYDPVNNNLLSKTENGITTKYGNYDSNGNYQCRVEGVTGADTSTGVCAFDPVVSPAARRTDYTYDSRYLSKVATKTEASVYSGGNKVTSYTYDDFGNRLSETIDGFDPSGIPVTRTTTYQYNGPLHQLSQINGPRTDISDITALRYYPDDPAEGNNWARLKEIEDANGVLIRSNIQYTPTSKVASEVRPDNLLLSYAYYPGNDRLETLTESDGSTSHVTRWTYLATGEVETITTADGMPEATTITLGYDDARRLTRITDGLGNYMEYILDTEGNREEENIHDSSGVLKKALIQTFDVYNRLDTMSQANEGANYDFAPDGTLDQQTDGKGGVTDFSYDALKRLLTSTQDLNGLGASTRYDYDVADNLISVIDPVNGNTRYSYDDLGNLLQTISPDTGTTVSTYDEAGNLKTRIDAKGGQFTYSYDALNRLTTVNAPGTADDITYGYDTCTHGVGQLCSVTLGSMVETYNYDAFGNIAGHQQLVYGYDAASRLKTLTYPSGAVVTYHYDAAGQVNQVDLIEGGDTTVLASNVTYAPFGVIEGLVYGNGATLSQNVDAAYRVTDQSVPGALDLGYTLYDANGNLEIRTDTYMSTGSFAYDALNRLDTASGIFGSRDYDYDLNGNRTNLISDAITTSYGYTPGSNRFATKTGWSYTLDAKGNTTEQLDVDGAGRLYAFNTHNRLINAVDRTVIPGKGKKPPTITDTVLADYIYNGLGQRVSKDIGDVITQYLYGTNGALMTELDGTGLVRREYIWLNGQLLALTDVSTSQSDGPETINDNGEAGTTSAGSWTTKTNNSDYGIGYLLANSNSTPSTYRWTPTLTAGTYKVYAWWVSSGGYSANVPYTVSHNNQMDTVMRSHKQNGGSWQLLGTWDFDGSGTEYIEVSNANGKATADAVRFVSQGTPTTETNIYYVHNDHLGTPQAMTNAAGTTAWRATYDPFGNAVVDEDPDGDGMLVTMNVRLPGQYYDQETGLHYNYFRAYDPSAGRYITSDPIGLAGGLNTYAYVEGNPLKFVDPFGLETQLCLRGLGKEPSGSAPPILNHTYGCVGNSSNGWTCGSSTASSGSALDNTWPFGPGSEGEATTDKTDYFDEQSCHKVLDDDDCVEQCIIDKWKQPRPWYQVGPGGTDCQEYTYDVLISCERSCRK